MPPVTASRRKGIEEVHWLLKDLLSPQPPHNPRQVRQTCLPSNHSLPMPSFCHFCKLFCSLHLLVCHSIGQMLAKRAHWVITSYPQHFLTWKMIQWRVELEGLHVFSMFKYSPELSCYPLQFVKLGIIPILCLIIWRTSSKYRLPMDSGWCSSLVS